jgi:hypothetical protein
MGLYKGQNIITGCYMLPRAEDIRQINISRERRSKKRERRGRKTGVGRKGGKQKKHKFTLFTTRGAYDIRRKGIHCVSE